jgi:AcrR family transcriptional regulator
MILDTMSSETPRQSKRAQQAQATRRRIFEQARRLLEERGYHGVGMGEIASAAGITRAALYLHFESKTSLLLQLVEWVDQVEGLAGLLAPLSETADPIARLDLAIELPARYEPRIHKLALALDTLRQTDEAAAAAWNDRMAARRGYARSLIDQLADNGLLRTGITRDAATDVVWTLIGVHFYHDLVVERGWPIKRFVKLSQQLAHAAVLK